MTKRKMLVAGNWKMNNGLEASLGLTSEIKGILNDEKRNQASVVLIPPFISLSAMHKLLSGNDISLGAQNMHEQINGAYTGEISATMLQSVGCSYVLVGHSERRQYFGENNALLNKKLHSALSNGLIPIYCVGESLAEREEGSFWEILASQITEGMAGLDPLIDGEKVVIAYEPVWAIGTGKTASAAQAQEVHAFIRQTVANSFGGDLAASIRILYGGSVKPDNAESLFSQPDIDGGLIGGAALNSRDFCNIVHAAS